MEKRRDDDVALSMFVEGFADVMQDFNGLFLFVWEVPAYRYHVWPVRGVYNAQDGEQYDLDQYLDNVIYSADRELAGDRFHAMFNGTERSVNFSCRIQDVTGKHRWANFHLQNQFNDDGSVRLVGGYVTSIEDLRRQDPLTGLFTDEQCSLDYAEGMPGEEGYLLRLDIDDMSFVNELHGREFGDKILKKIAGIVVECLGMNDRCYRAADDVFTIVMPDASRERAVQLYEAVNRRVAEYCKTLEQDLPITLSAGAAHWPSDSTGFSTLNRYAAGAMNTAKLAGKNTQVFFQLEEYEKYQKDLGLRADISRCVHNGLEGFSLNFQPQVSLKNGRVVSAEALLRWTSQEQGMVSPFHFVPVLEKTGLIIEVGRWVIDQALAQCAVWRKTEPEFVMGVNVAYHQLANDDLVSVVSDALKKYNLPGSCLMLELTESEQLANYGYFNQQLEPLHEMGVCVAIDDFGTGYSSLGYFKELHINQVKIDRCFVTRIRESEYDYRLIEFITELAHSTNMEVCVEGVETADELRALMPLEPDLIQGYYFGRPVSADVFTSEVLSKAQMMSWDTLREARQMAAEGRDMSPLTLNTEDEFINMVDTLPELVYLTEMDTGRLIYMNKQGCVSCGVKDYVGKACYQVLRGKERPCKNCMEMQLNRDEFVSRKPPDQYSAGKSAHMIKMMPWKGRMVRLGVGILAETLAQDADNMEKLLAGCMRSMLAAPNSQRSMEIAVWYLKNWYAPDRVHIYSFSDDKSMATRVFSRTNDRVDPFRDLFRVTERKYFPGWWDELLDNRCVAAYDKEAIARDYPTEYATLQKMGAMKPVMMAPLSVAGNVLGLVKIDNPTRHEAETLFAADVGALIASELQKLELAETPFSNALGLW